jgi:hypothetical protein
MFNNITLSLTGNYTLLITNHQQVSIRSYKRCSNVCSIFSGLPAATKKIKETQVTTVAVRQFTAPIMRFRTPDN